MISFQPVNSTYYAGQVPNPLSIVASSKDGGNISIDWYQNVIKSNKGGVWVGEGNDFIPSTAKQGHYYYYAIVSNSLTSFVGLEEKNNIATIYSDVVTVTVNHPIITGIDVIPPSKTEYKVGENLNKSNIIVNVIYSNGNIAKSNDYNLEYDFSDIGKKTVRISYWGYSYYFTVDVIRDETISTTNTTTTTTTATTTPITTTTTTTITTTTTTMTTTTTTTTMMTIVPIQTTTTPLQKIRIITQFENAIVANGDIATFTLNAEGVGLIYKWYYKNKNDSRFYYTKTFDNMKTYSVEMNDVRDGRQIYCVITDKYGNSVQSEIVTLYMGSPVEITEQPEIIVAAYGTEAKATIKAEGDGLTYKWYYKNKSDSKFYYTKTFDNKKTYSVKMSDSRDGRQVYCIVTDKYGKSEQSEVITLYMGNPLTITNQPINTSAEYGNEAKVRVSAKGDGLTYKWYYKNKGDSKFCYTKTFDNKTTYSAEMNEARDGRQVYCEITDKYGVTIQTEIVTLGLPVAITENLVNTAAELGEKVELSVSATGHGLTYEWYYKNSTMNTFALTKSYKNNKYNIDKMTEARAGREVYCVITDIFGNSVQTETVTIGLPVEIIEQPVNTSAEYGSEAKVRVTAKGDDLTYKWYYKNKNDSKFRYTNTFDNKTTYSAEMNESRDGRQIYCEITDKYGVTIQTEIVTIGLPVVITENLVNTAAELGEKVELSVSATGHGLTYEWHYKNKNMNKFDVTESFKTNTYSLDKMTEARAGREVYCVITDIFGNSVQTETVRIDLPDVAADCIKD